MDRQRSRVLSEDRDVEEEITERQVQSKHVVTLRDLAGSRAFFRSILHHAYSSFNYRPGVSMNEAIV